MVAGMLMPLDHLRAIYEVLFREGVMVAKKDRRPRSLHPHVPGVTNLQVARAMASLRARGLVRETFAWRHCYWYLTNEGVAHLRQYLHLPPEIVPASLQRVRRPVAMVTPARRTPHVQTVQGPLGCPPKRGLLSAEDPAREERRVYRRKEPEEGPLETPLEPATTLATLARPSPEPAPTTGLLVRAAGPCPPPTEQRSRHRCVLAASEGLVTLPTPLACSLSAPWAPVAVPNEDCARAEGGPHRQGGLWSLGLLPSGREGAVASRSRSPALGARCCLLCVAAMEPSGSLFPSLVVVGHVVTLAAVWHWRRGRRPAPDAEDERDRVQKKTFTKWVNKHLIKRHVSDLYEDLRDGHNLISLLEVLSGDSLPREKGRMRFHKLQNVQIALDYLRHRQVKLVNIRNDDIADGNPKLTLGLIWTIILHFQISDIQVSGQSEDMTAKEKLLLWSQRMVEGYQGLRCDNFTSSWRDGRLFNAIIHRHRPTLIDMSKVYRQTNLQNLDQAFSVAERDLGVTRLLDPEGMCHVDVPQPDEKSIITYVSSLYDAMPRVPDAQDGVKANELQLRWQEYRELALLLLQWIRHHTAAFEERRFPSSFEEIEILWCQFLKFKETELPAKEADKNRSKGIYQSLEGSVQAGQLKVPPGCHPLDVEKEWGKLHVAILEREKQLRGEFERLEGLQRIVSKLQMEAGLCEEQLSQADALLQADVRLLAAGKVPQRAGEVDRDLDKADAMIRLLFNDVQTLKDGRHPQPPPATAPTLTALSCPRVYRLHERLVALRTEYNLRLKAGVAAPVAQVAQSMQRRPELEDSALRYLQDLLAWVEENQRRVDSAEWGADLPSVEAQLGSHRGLHQSVEEFRAKIERARGDEGQLPPPPGGPCRDCLGRLDLQYAKLLNSSKARLRSLEALHGFVGAATKELMWLNEKEEEEVAFDWSEHNANMAAKKESYSALMRELELKEKRVKEIQSTGDRLLREDHPARPTVESFQAALQTQWSWVLQLCCCIEAHLKENTAYFQFFADVREAEEQLQKLQETLRRKYNCDRSVTVTRLEDLLQDAQVMPWGRSAARSCLEHPRRVALDTGVATSKGTGHDVLEGGRCPVPPEGTDAPSTTATSPVLVPGHPGPWAQCWCSPGPKGLAEGRGRDAHKGHLLGLAKRAKAIVQLKPRSLARPVRGPVPLLAVCDYRQVEVTVHKGDQCQLLGPAQPSHWTVLSSSGAEAAVPSVCFLVPPPNPEAQEAVSRLEAQHQALVTLWQQLHVDLKSLLAWQSLSRDVQLIRSWSLVTFRTLKPEEQRQALHSLELHYQAFLRDSQDAGGFGPEDRLAGRGRDGPRCMSPGEQEESRCQRCISELRDVSLQLGPARPAPRPPRGLPLDKEPARECAQRIAEQQAGRPAPPLQCCSGAAGPMKAQAEVEGLGKGVTRLSAEAEKVLALPEPSPAAPTLRSELELTLGKLEQVRSLSAIYLEKLKTISLVIHSTQGAEEVLRAHEEQLKEAQAVPATLPELEATKASLKVLGQGWSAQAEAKQPVFSALRDELRGAQEVGERLQQRHGERDVACRWPTARPPGTSCSRRRWEAALYGGEGGEGVGCGALGRVFTTLPSQALLEEIGRHGEKVEECQRLAKQYSRQPGRPGPAAAGEGGKQHCTALLEEIGRHGEKVEECQRLAKQYINAIKDYELQLVTYKAQLEPVASPAKRPKVQSGSESVIQEYVDLRTRYSELTTLTSQYVRFIGETLRRMEEEERLAEQQRAEERERLAQVEAALEKQRQLAEAHAQAKAQAEQEARELQRRMQEEVARREEAAVDAQQQKRSIQEELQHVRQSSEAEIQARARQVEAAERSRLRIEEEIRTVRLQLEATERQRGGAEEELQALRARAEEAEAQKRQAQEEAERLRRQVQDESQRKRQAEAELALRVKAEAEAAREKQRALQALEELRLQAEEADRRLRQAEAERARQVQVALETAQRSAEVELQSKRASFAEKTAQLERTLQEEHVTVAQLREEAERRAQQQAEAERAREEAERELERWQLKANEALRLRLQAEEVAQQKSLAQAEAEKQKEEAEREARRRGKAEEQAVRQRELAEQELEKQRQLAEGTAQQRLAAEQELIRLRAETEQGEQQRQLLEEELARLQHEVAGATQKRQELEAELAKVRAEMEVLLASKARAEEESRSTTEKSKQRLEAEAGRFRELAEEAARLRALAEEAKRQRQLAEEDAARQRAEAERVLAEKLAAISEATRLKTEAEIALKEKEAENERLRRLAEDEAFQRRRLEEQAAQHKADIEERLAQLRKASESELERQKGLVEDTLRQRRQVEEEIHALKASFEKAAAGKAELELELGRIRSNAEDTLRSKEQAELEAARQRQLAAEEEQRRREAEDRVQKSLAAEQEAARQRKAALDEVERLKAKVEEARRLRERAEQESARQLQLAQEAAQKRLQAEEKAHAFVVQQREQELQQTLQQEHSVLERLRGEAEAARRAAEEAEAARDQAEHEAAQSRRQVEEAERLKQTAEEQAQAQAQAQAAAEKLRKEAEQEAARRAQAEQAALRQKEAADAEMQKHKKFAEQTLRQKAQMEELGKLKARIEAENRALILRDKDNTQRFLEEEAEKMKQVAEEAARLSIAAQEAARLRQLAEEDLVQQRALAEKMLKEKIQALEMSAEAERLKLRVVEMSRAQARAEEDAQRFRKQAEEIGAKLHRTELATQEKVTLVQTLEVQRQQSDRDAERLREAIAELEREKDRLQQEARLLQLKSEEMQTVQQEQLLQETQALQRSFLSEKDSLLERERFIEQEKAKLERLFQDEVAKAQQLREEQLKQQQQMEQERQELGGGQGEVAATRASAAKALPNGRDAPDGPTAEVEPEHAFDGLRQKVPAQRLQEAGILGTEELQRLAQGHTTVAELARRGDVRQYLQGHSSVAGLLLKPNGEKLSIYAALRRQLLSPGTALILLEAQAASGFLLDPGFFDPNTHENLTYLQLLERCVEDPDTGLRLLPLTDKAAKGAELVYTDSEARDVFEKATVSAPFGKFQGRTVTIWEIINSEHFTAEQRRDLLRQFRTGRITVEKVIKIVITVVEEQERKGQLCFEGLRALVPAAELLEGRVIKIVITVVEEQERKGQLCFEGLRALVPAAELLEGRVIEQGLYRQLQRGERSVQEVAEVDAVRRGCAGVIAGVWLEEAAQRLSIYEALQRELLEAEVAVALLEAQAGRGHILDPATSARLTVDEAVRAGLVGPELHEKLLSAEKAVTGYRDPYSGQSVPLFQAWKKGLIPREQGMRLLDAQLSTGGIVDPSKSLRVPRDVACARGCLDEETSRALSTPQDGTGAYRDPSTEEPVTYGQLQQRCRPDGLTGLSLLPLSEKATRAQQQGLCSERQARETLEKATVEVPVGSFQGRTVTVWELISSEYFTEEQRQELLRQFRTGKVTVEKVIKILITIVEEVETRRQDRLSFSGLPAPVPASELLAAGVLSQAQFKQLTDGGTSVRELSEVGSVRTLLQGSGCLAGIYLEDCKEKVTIYEAMHRGLLRPSTATLLLEAQAATGFLLDPVRNQRLYVHEAVKAGVVGPELHEKLLSAEKAVTGYRDPYSGSTACSGPAQPRSCLRPRQPLASCWTPSAQWAAGPDGERHCGQLFPTAAGAKAGMAAGGPKERPGPAGWTGQAHDCGQDRSMVDSRAVHVLGLPGAVGRHPLATGGLLGPAHRLRLPLEAAVRSGCLDEGTEQQLSQVAGFLDPRTHEHLRYGELLARCVTDLETGLAFLPLPGVAHGERPGPLFIEHRMRQALSAATVAVSVGKFRGRPVSLWELLLSEAVPVEKRVVLARRHQEGALPVEELAIELKAIVEQATATSRAAFTGLRGPVSAGELLAAGIIDQKLYEQLECGHATAQDVSSLGTVRRFLQGTGCVAGLLLPGTQERVRIHEARGRGLLRPGTALLLLEAQGKNDPKDSKRYSVEEALQAGVIGPDVYAKLLSAERAVAYQRGYFDQALNSILADPSDDTKGFFDPNTHENLTYLQLLERCVEDPDTGLRLLPLSSEQPQWVDGSTRQAFQNLLLPIKYGRFQGQMVSAWELVNSEYFREDWRRRLLQRYRLREVTLQQVAQLLESESQRWADITLPALRGRVTAHQLLEAGIIEQELLEQVLAGTVSPEELLHVDSVHRCLRGSGAVSGVLLQPSGQCLGLYQAMKQKLLGPGVAVALLEAQAATGAITDPHSLEALSVDEAVCRGVVGPELHGRLRRVECAVTGFRDPFSGKQVSLFQAMKKGLVPVEQATRLLEAQVATGGVIDPTGHHHIPMPVAIQRGCIDPEMQGALFSSPETFPMLDGHGCSSYAQLLEQCPRHEASGLHLLSLPEGTPAVLTEEQVKDTLQATPGAGDGLSLWDQLCYHCTEGQRAGLLEDVLVGRATVSQLQATVQRWVQAAELAQARVSVPGPRVRACLWGTGCVAGVLLQPSGAKASITQAVREGLLPPGLGQRLLEAQVASGSLIDPLTGQRLSVEDAVKAGLVSVELSEQLGQVERTVAGCRDPCSGGLLSLWQAMEKGLVSRAEGLPLLQAQLATGGVLEPEHGVHLQQALACRLGLLDQQTARELAATDEGSKFFFDPNTQNRVDHHTTVALRAMRVRVSMGRFCGHSVSLWDLLCSEYVSADKRQELAALCRSGRAAALHQVVCAVTALVEAAERLPPQVTFPGLRKQVSAGDLFRSQLISKETLDELRQGRRTVQEVARMDSVRQALEGGSYIAGVVVQATQERLSIPEALRRHILKPGTALVLLEAQAATGFIIDPVQNRRLTVEQAFQAGMFGKETYTKLLSAERAVTGYTDPYTGERISLFQAMQKGLIVAYQRGYFDEETNRVLADPGDDTKGFFDPNTHENLTYLQLLRRCMRDPKTGLYMLQLVKEGDACTCVEEDTRRALQATTTHVPVGVFTGHTVSLWDLLSSQYFTEAEKRELLRAYRAQNMGLDELLATVTSDIEETERRYRAIKVEGLHGEVTAAELLNSGVVDKKALEMFREGAGGGQDLGQLQQVRACLDGHSCVAGVVVPSTQEVMCVDEASRNGLIPAGFAARLLEAQAATGFLLDPRTHQKLWR
ncbi:Plectin [Tupaia chinensis]|uniref:Plectin n=1 Tax=Tupaia chinensis TaxID=246437 RepID=L9KQD7_TUPCH|nr:Plectin [Tupaia chinensis]